VSSHPDATPHPSAGALADALVDALAHALGALGIRGSVEARERLAVLVVDAATAAPDLADAELRRAALALARAHGFTHLALELGDDGDVPSGASGGDARDRAAFPRD
jgi:hypothetical protein